MNDPGSNDNPRPSSTADSVRHSTLKKNPQSTCTNRFENYKIQISIEKCLQNRNFLSRLRYRQYVQTHGINASPKKAAANPGNRSASKDRLVKGDEEVERKRFDTKIDKMQSTKCFQEQKSQFVLSDTIF